MGDSDLSRRPGRRRRELSLPLGRIAGVPVRVHVTLVALFALLALGAFGPSGPGIVESSVWPALLFASVLVHELAHSVVARRRGVPVTSIVLLPIGGVSRLGRLPDRPRDELVIAAVGPATSLGTAAVLAALLTVTGHALTPVSFVDGPLGTRLVWANAVLAAFNLLPAFPLDGGRVLRAALARRLGLETATRRAASVGWLLGSAMVAFGLVVDVWMVVIGVVVMLGGVAEEAATVVHLRLGGRHVRDAMREHPLTIGDSEVAGTARTLASWNRQPVVPVTHDGCYTGVVTAADLARTRPSTAVWAVVHEVETVAPDEDLEEAVEHALWPSRLPAVAVVEEGRVVGLLTRDDVQAALAGRERRPHDREV
jgi:stage IV sporulation protein FB